MPDFNSYCNFWDLRSAFAITNGEKSFATKAALPGVQIMKDLGNLLRPGDTLAMKVEGLFRVYVEYSRNNNWKWAGGGACGTPKILDAPQPPLECQAFAVGLKALMIAPPPFGLGIPDAQVSTRPFFEGKLVRGQKVGFVARHPTEGVLSLAANVISGGMVDESLLPGFYVWANHKVVGYGGKFFDPSYGCQYEKLEEMVYLEIEDYGIAKDEGIVTSEAIDTQRWESEAGTDQTGKYFLKCKSGQSRTYYLKVRKVNQRTIAGLQYEGPFVSL